jgi:hypothetical protein
MRFLMIVFLGISIFKDAHSHCFDRHSRWDCERFQRCSWGAVGCTSKKYLRQEKSSVLNYLGFNRD